MNSLKPSEVSELIDHQMKTAGAAKVIFNDNACKAIHSLSGDIVRKIGKLVDKSLVLGVSPFQNSLKNKLNEMEE